MLRHLNVCLDLFDHVHNRFDKKDKLRTTKQIISLHIWLIISRSEDSQTMKFGQLTEYNVRNMYIQFEDYKMVLKVRCWPLITLLTLYSFNWPNFIAWLPLLLEILGNMCMVIICFPLCDFMNFEIRFSFLIKPFSYITKKSRQKFEYLEKRNLF